MRRIDCLAAIYDDLRDCAVVTIMGAVAAELYSLGHRANFFYLEHAMGLASSMGLGIALAQPQRRVVVIDGDGSVLMNLGGLTTLARYAPPNLTHLVFDNESLLSVGGFPTATATGSDLAAIARGAGIANARPVENLEDFVAAARDAIAAPELTCVVAKVEAVGPTSFHMDLHLLENRFEFARALRLPAAGTLPEQPPPPAPRAAEPVTAAPTIDRAAFPDPAREETR
jgi:sulfopyruvate decarboxylase subunit beta